MRSLLCPPDSGSGTESEIKAASCPAGADHKR